MIKKMLCIFSGGIFVGYSSFVEANPLSRFWQKLSSLEMTFISVMDMTPRILPKNQSSIKERDRVKHLQEIHQNMNHLIAFYQDQGGFLRFMTQEEKSMLSSKIHIFKRKHDDQNDDKINF